MPSMTGGQALAQSLQREGVRVVFGLPGVQTYHALDGLYDLPDVRFLTTRHEQATTYMADGYARAGRRPGVAMVVPGVGVYNAAAGLATAYAASSPVFLVSGQVNQDFLGRDVGVLHEVHDQLEIVRPITKWRTRVLDARDIPGAVHEAFRQMKTGRPRPVEVEVPPETFADEVDVELFEAEEYPPPAPGSVEDAARILSRAERPLIWAGGGAIISGASEPLTRLAEHLQAPVITTPEGKGAISERHELSVGIQRRAMTPLQELVTEADVVLAVGTRFADANLKSTQRVIQMDVDPNVLGRTSGQVLGIVADAREGLSALYGAVQGLTGRRSPRHRELEDLRQRVHERFAQIEPQASIVKTIREVMPEDGILVSGMTQIGYFSHVAYPVYEPGTYLTSSYMGTLGYAYPVALGAKTAAPDRAVLAISGDGGFLYSSQELATAVKYGINVVALVFNDNAYGNSLRDQTQRFDGRIIGTELHNPDFVKLAEAYGADGMRVEHLDSLGPVLREALANGRPTVVEVPVGPMPSPWQLPPVPR